MAGQLVVTANVGRSEDWQCELVVDVSKESSEPFGMTIDPQGRMLFVEYKGHRLRALEADGSLTTLCGDGTAGYSGDGGPAASARLNAPHEVRLDADGNIYIADSFNHVVRRIDSETGIIETLAGTGEPGFGGDGGDPKAALFNQTISIEFAGSLPSSLLLICDIKNQRIRQLSLEQRRVETLAGNGTRGEILGGTAWTATPLPGPRSLAFDNQGRMLVAFREGNQIQRFDLKTQQIEHVAGTGEKGAGEHGQLAKNTQLNGPKGISVDRRGRIWIADTENHLIRYIDPDDGKIYDAVGVRRPQPAGVVAIALARPHGIYAAADGSVYFSDSEHHKIYRLTATSNAP